MLGTKILFGLAAVAASAGSLLLTVTPARAQVVTVVASGDQLPSARVRVADLTLTAAAGQKELTSRVSRAVRKVCARAATCTVLVVSGRPMIIPPELLSQIDALVASWLPGSEGMGVADVLFGRKPFTGKLPVTWPRSVAQEPINVGDADYDPLYRYGFGLRTR